MQNRNFKKPSRKATGNELNYQKKKQQQKKNQALKFQHPYFNMVLNILLRNYHKKFIIKNM